MGDFDCGRGAEHDYDLSVCLDCVRAETERETVAAIVAWLRAFADQSHTIEAGELMFTPATRGTLHMAATEIASGAWKEGR